MATALNGSILKAFDILRLVSRECPDLTAAMVAADLGMNFATAHRFLATLAEAGALVAVRRGVYRLSLATAALGLMAEQTNPVAPVIQPVITALSAALRESVMVCRLGRTGPVCVAVALADRPINVSIRVGVTLDPVHSAQGRLWLAAMPPDRRAAALAAVPVADREWLAESLSAIRQTGVAHNLGQVEPDIAAVAAPVRNARGEVVLTLSVFGPLGRFTPAFIDLAQRRVLDAAGVIGARMPG